MSSPIFRPLKGPRLSPKQHHFHPAPRITLLTIPRDLFKRCLSYLPEPNLDSSKRVCHVFEDCISSKPCNWAKAKDRTELDTPELIKRRKRAPAGTERIIFSAFKNPSAPSSKSQYPPEEFGKFVSRTFRIVALTSGISSALKSFIRLLTPAQRHCVTDVDFSRFPAPVREKRTEKALALFPNASNLTFEVSESNLARFLTKLPANFCGFQKLNIGFHMSDEIYYDDEEARLSDDAEDSFVGSLTQYLERYPNTQSLNLAYEFYDDNFEQVFDRRWNSLEEFVYPYPLEDAQLEILLSQAPRLARLEVNGAALNGPSLEHARSLRNLTIHSSEKISPTSLKRVLVNNAPHLEEISLFYNSSNSNLANHDWSSFFQFDPHFFENIPPFPNLRNLDIQAASAWSSSHSPQLGIATLLESLSEQSLPNLLDKFPNLSEEIRNAINLEIAARQAPDASFNSNEWDFSPLAGNALFFPTEDWDLRLIDTRLLV